MKQDFYKKEKNMEIGEVVKSRRTGQKYRVVEVNKKHKCAYVCVPVNPERYTFFDNEVTAATDKSWEGCTIQNIKKLDENTPEGCIIDSDTILADLLEKCNYQETGLAHEIFDIYKNSTDKEAVKKLFHVFTDVEFEYKGIEFKAQICLLDTGKVMISFRVPKNELEQNLCKGLLNSRGTKLDIKINHLPMCANVDTCSFAILKGSSLFSDFSITVENNLILREDSI